jgi:prepilin-type N-terminal cleavage/methylation domain-containing protein/prepilin-type processing-associated H-X9-DG protein
MKAFMPDQRAHVRRAFFGHYPRHAKGTVPFSCRRRPSFRNGARSEHENRDSPLRAFTLVELLVVIAIIGILMALLIPGVQAAKQAALSARCKNNLNQLGLAVQTHHSTFGCYPSAGWGYGWGPHPDRHCQDQTGGWTYSLLPYLDAMALFEKLPMDAPVTARDYDSMNCYPTPAPVYCGLFQDNIRRLQTPLAVLHCPARRRAVLYPIGNDNFDPSVRPFLVNAGTLNELKSLGDVHLLTARTDYAINGGEYAPLLYDGPWQGACSGGGCEFGIGNGPPGPPWTPDNDHEKSSDAIKSKYSYMYNADRQPNQYFPPSGGPYYDPTAPPEIRGQLKASGISYAHSSYTSADVPDGTSNTYLIGEKYLDPDHYADGLSTGDDQGPYLSDDQDSMRFAAAPSGSKLGGTPVEFPPMRDLAGTDPGKDKTTIFTWGFGGPHVNGFNMVMCDGSVRTISYGISKIVHHCLCNRADHQPIDPSTIP